MAKFITYQPKQRLGRKARLSMVEVMALRLSKESHHEAAARLRVPYHVIYNARFGRTWAHLRVPAPWVSYVSGPHREVLHTDGTLLPKE